MSKKTKNKAAVSDKKRFIKELIKQLNKARKTKAKSKKKSKPKLAQAETKQKKQEQKSIDYRSKAKLDYQRARFYAESTHSVDYGELFSYLGTEYRNPADTTDTNYSQVVEKLTDHGMLGSEVFLAEHQLEEIIRREQMSAVSFTSDTLTSAQDRQKYKYWKEANRLWNMIMVERFRTGGGASGLLYI